MPVKPGETSPVYPFVINLYPKKTCMKTNKFVKALLLTGFFFLAFTSINNADAQRRQPYDRIENRIDRKEDVRDRKEDVRDRRENVRDRREDRRDAMHNGGVLDRLEDIRDRREDVIDRKEDVRDRREDVRHRREDRRDRRF